MSDQRKPCIGTGSKKNAAGNWISFKCGMLTEPGCDHCTVHLTEAEKAMLKRQREQAREQHP